MGIIYAKVYPSVRRETGID